MSPPKKKPYTPPRAESRRWCEETMSAEDWRFIMESVDGFAFVGVGPTEVWPVANGDDGVPRDDAA